MWLGLVLGLGLGLGLVLGLGLDYGLGFSSDIRLRHDPQLRVSHLATTMSSMTETTKSGEVFLRYLFLV